MRLRRRRFRRLSSSEVRQRCLHLLIISKHAFPLQRLERGQFPLLRGSDITCVNDWHLAHARKREQVVKLVGGEQ